MTATPCSLESRKQDENVVDLRRREPRHRLVRDQQLGLRRHRARKLELPHVHLREPRTSRAPCRARPTCSRMCIASSEICPLPSLTCCLAAYSSGMHRLSSTDMLTNGLGIWKLRASPRRTRRWAASPPMSRPSKRMLPDSLRSVPGDAVHQRALARTVRADQAEPLARPHDRGRHCRAR